MDRVHSLREASPDQSHWIAVLIGESDVDQRHIGILHRTAESQASVLHLAWHCILQNDNDIPEYMSVWIPPDFPEERLQNLSAFCRRIWRKNNRGGIPYAFSRHEGAFSLATGQFLVGPSRFGLTCATFVLAVFERAGLTLLDTAEWPTDRLGDREWQESIIQKLEQRATPEHIGHLRTEIGSVRYRPEEVAAGAALVPPPAEFETAAELGSAIVERIRQPTAGQGGPSSEPETDGTQSPGIE